MKSLLVIAIVAVVALSLSGCSMIKESPIFSHFHCYDHHWHRTGASYEYRAGRWSRVIYLVCDVCSETTYRKYPMHSH